MPVRPSGSRSDAVSLCIGLATLLFIAQLVVGTAPYFAFAVYLAVIAVILTVRTLGLGSIGGLLIAFMSVKVLIFSQVVKTVLGQPGDSNLLAPDATIFVVLVGTVSACAGALLANGLLKGRSLIQIEPSAETLGFVRNASLAVGIALTLLSGAFGTDTFGEREYGGINGVFNQFVDILWLAPFAETLRILVVTKGKRSTSPLLYTMILCLVMWGFLNNSKAGMALSVFAYLLAAIPYRGYVSRAQVLAIGAVLLGGITIAYPAVQMLRNERDLNGLTVAQVTDFVSQSVADPVSFFDAWAEYRDSVNLGDSRFTDAAFYLGFYDELAIRFAVIAVTDTIVDAVRSDGPYGSGIVTFGLNLVLPTFLSPDKPRENIGDLITWYYGLRGWGINGNPAIGLFGESYAAAEWAGVALLPFVLVFFYFSEIQLAGTRLAGNCVGAFFIIKHYGFGEEGVVASVVDILRNNILDLALLLAIFFAADLFIARRSRRRVVAAETDVDEPDGPTPAGPIRDLVRERR